ncbi:MAG: efflux RND transporter periplasmic adaptor subunit [Chlamydiales bacterium]|nr:efflux RND transporter periplasmic adaptor subunit [Chlamydiales bacterium]
MKKLLLFLLIAIAIIAITAAYLDRGHKQNTDELVLYGNVDVRQVELGFRVAGRVVFMPFQEGDQVEVGQLMARLDQQPFWDQVRQAEANLESVKTSLDNAEKVYARRKILVETGGVSTEDFDNSLSSRNVFQSNQKQSNAALGVALTDLRDTEVYAPASGVILTRIREPGTVVKPSDPVYTLSLSDPIWVRAFVTEPQLGLIYQGMPAEVYTDTPDGKVYTGHIGFISPVAEFTPKTVETSQLRTDLVYRLRVIADNPDKFLKQGMPVTVKFKLDQNKDAR